METLWRKCSVSGEPHISQTPQSHTLQLCQPARPYTAVCTPEQKVGLFLQRLSPYVFLSKWPVCVTLPADTLRGDQNTIPTAGSLSASNFEVLHVFVSQRGK